MNYELDMTKKITYHNPPMRFDVGVRQFVPDLPKRYEKVTNPVSDREMGVVAWFLIGVLVIVFLYFLMIRYYF